MDARARLAAALSLALPLGALAACGTTTQQATPAAKTMTVTTTARAKPAPTVTKTKVRTHVRTRVVTEEADPNAGSASTFEDDYESAGITAPIGWATDTAAEVCADWQTGEGTGTTDALLLDGGIYANHLRTFSDIIEIWFCPGDQP
ncbi:hypothetical protein [Actinomadura parmotrematis]|uniref:DUF732 domain-containing protein n=1 Tax=Actinomadura parmotrematis TaxID=2864039 RepID=A0ABS7FPQ7_9ACTN|nr:hypothetical protein [Actinomadura parmotrematis]MBW8482291.1 hypothetical protein [Actinomadura parmotrematis]